MWQCNSYHSELTSPVNTTWSQWLDKIFATITATKRIPKMSSVLLSWIWLKSSTTIVMVVIPKWLHYAEFHSEPRYLMQVVEGTWEQLCLPLERPLDPKDQLNLHLISQSCVLENHTKLSGNHVDSSCSGSRIILTPTPSYQCLIENSPIHRSSLL